MNPNPDNVKSSFYSSATHYDTIHNHSHKTIHTHSPPQYT